LKLEFGLAEFMPITLHDFQDIANRFLKENYKNIPFLLDLIYIGTNHVPKSLKSFETNLTSWKRSVTRKSTKQELGLSTSTNYLK